MKIETASGIYTAAITPDLGYLAQAAIDGADYGLARLVDLAREGEATDGQLRELADVEREFRDWEEEYKEG